MSEREWLEELRHEDKFPTPDQIAMGDDGTGRCAGCGIDICQFDPSCDTCMLALDVISGEFP